MKKIITAWIEQIVEFDSDAAKRDFISELNQSKRKYMIISQEGLRLHIRKQYNNNAFPQKGSE
jgi:hypothetical protein